MQQIIYQCEFLGAATIILGIFALWLGHEIRKEIKNAQKKWNEEEQQ